MKKILAFCFFPAFVPPTNGGQSRLFNFYKALSEKFEITLLTSTHIGDEEQVINHGVGFVERRIPKDEIFSEQWSILSQFSSGGDLSGPCIAACGKYPTRLHQAYFEEYEEADAIIHDGPFTIEYDLFAGLDHKPRIYNSYNCESKLYRQLHINEKSDRIQEIVYECEMKMLECSDLLLYCSDDDLSNFRGMASKAFFEAIYLPNGITPNRIEVFPDTPTREMDNFSAVFLGSGHPPNTQAAEYIVRILASQLPEITFDIMGSCLPEGKYPPNVKRHGVVSDELKNKILTHADIALNPMTSGSGSNVKVLDYFSYRLPVISTHFGMRGIQAVSGKEYLEATLDLFPETIRAVINDKEFLDSIAKSSNTMVLERYTWEAIAQPAVQAIKKCVDIKSSMSKKQIVLALNDYDSYETKGGGATRTLGLYEAVREWSPVVFISFSNHGNLQVKKTEGITFITVPKSPAHLADLNRVNSHYHVSADDIIAGRHCAENPYFNFLYRVLRNFARCIVIEHCYMVGLPLMWGDRFVYSSQNNETELKKRLLADHPLKSELLPDVESLERYAVEYAAVTIAVSQEDAASLVKFKKTSGPVVVVRNGAAMPKRGNDVDEAKQNLSKKINERSVVFLGSAHMPNIESAKHIIEIIAPYCTDVQFHMIGSVCDALDKIPANVHLWGVIDDVTKSAIMQICPVAINPMFSGSGSNVKLADYIGNGLYVVTTDFGVRGYPEIIKEHVKLVSIEQFGETILSLLSNNKLFSEEKKQARQALFNRELAMKGLAKRFVDTIQKLELKKKRILFVTYRYTTPLAGGAEVFVEKLIRALGHSEKFDVDVVSPEVSEIQNHMRFSERYSFDLESSAPVDIPNVRFARFASEAPNPAFTDKWLRNAWNVQPKFERMVSELLTKSYFISGLAWGWDSPSQDGEYISRWAFVDCGMYLKDAAQINITGYAHNKIVVIVRQKNVVLAQYTLDGKFELLLDADAGIVEFCSSAPSLKYDPRPFAYQIHRVLIANQSIDLAAPTLPQLCLSKLEANAAFNILNEAATATRTESNLRLTDGRGPWSGNMERFIVDHVSEYDLVVTHNNVFRPAIVAIDEAKKQGVPSILIPHAHLDDDYYHFPDVLENMRNASLVLASPKVACNFLTEQGCTVRYLPAGCDTQEVFSERDATSFRQVYQGNKPFILVLGRKAGAKGYQQIIDTIDHLNSEGLELALVMIGPDDDGLPLSSQNTFYLGRQPRNVVRGALMSCFALCNMSSSESFGIVLLEAWLAGKPVIANVHCAAFHDMAQDGENALMVEKNNLAAAIKSLYSQPQLQTRLAEKGKITTNKFDWVPVTEMFIETCIELTS